MTPDVTLRAARAADITPLAALWHEGWNSGHIGRVPDSLAALRTRDSFRARIEAALDAWFIADDAAGIAGFIRLKGAELDQFYVAPRLIGLGMAMPLMRAAETLMRDRGVGRAHLVASAGNTRAIRFYRKAGWTDLGEMTDTVETAAGPYALTVVRFEKDLGRSDTSEKS